ncbi:hypothetical protein [Muribaculum intestinale]|jgi:hypothetical protein|uniref:hypothetical protein n=1 Tax=Muribaculum intestinale TaxID=1796646 RepID=UPI0026F3B0AE|nr:hypothetical protein [Muribaculum intestinale]
MRYTKNDIKNILLTEFMAALGEKPAVVYEGAAMYYTPYRDDPEPIFLVNTRTNIWHDYATDDSGGLKDLATLAMNPDVYKDPIEYILKMMNEYEQGKELSAMARRPQEPTVISLDIKKVKLTDFMKALGQEHPVAADGNLRIYNAPYDDKPGPTMVINTETNLWRDTKSGAYGGIYDLAYELTGSCNMSELNRYIASEMSALDKTKDKEQKIEPPKQEQKPDKPKRKMRL